MAELEATPKNQTKADKDAINKMYQKARRMTLDTGIKHEVDHIFPIKGKHHRGKHTIKNLQIVPKSWNASKNNRVPENWRDLWYQKGLL